VFLIVGISLAMQTISAAFTHFGKRDGAALPLKVSEVFGLYRSSKQAALDLWMTGIRGRDVLEAIYLEAISAAWKPTLIFSAILAFGPFYLIYPRENFGNPVMFAVACLTTFWAGYGFWRLSMTEFHFGGLRGGLNARLIVWKGDAWEEQLVPIVGRFFYAAAVLLIGGVGISFLTEFNDHYSAVLAYPNISGYQPSPELRAMMAENLHLSKAIFASIEIGLICWIVELLRRPVANDSIAAAIRTADAPFELYARRVICEDTDGSRARLREK
jgi:hypothetical protein